MPEGPETPRDPDRPDLPPLLEINDQFLPPTSPEFVAEVVAAVRAHVARPALRVSLLLCDDAEIARIHGEFMDDPTPTDVITFPMEENVELVVSVERAVAVAAERGHDARAELALYLIHGLLHACGYDDIDPADRCVMRDAERAVLGALGLRVTPVDEV